jgi:hypothetical protein
MTIRTSFRFTLPKGTGIKTEPGRKASGKMKLIQVKDLLTIERDSTVQKESGAFYVVLLSKTIEELGQEKMVTRKTIERLSPVDFAFLVDFMHEINHQVIRQLPITCGSCGHTYKGEFAQLGEA